MTKKHLFKATGSLFGSALAILLGGCTIAMPGKSYSGESPKDTPERLQLAERLRQNVELLFVADKERNIFNLQGLRSAEENIERSLREAGYEVFREAFVSQGVPVHNIRVELPGNKRPEEIVVVGAHYDSVRGSPGANDNGSGVALLIELARALSATPQERTVRLIFFVNEEPPFFWTEEMGSVHSAKLAKSKNEKIVAMLSLETLGYYENEKNTQRYPAILSWFYPSRGNFVAFVGMSSSSKLLKCAIKRFRHHATVPSEGAALPWIIPHVGSSDHWSYWREGYPAIMLTDTAMYRYRHYHTTEDKPARLNYRIMSQVFEGIEPMVRDLSRVQSIDECE